jgi:phosphoglycerate dehydrogenase-like enzyme
MSAVQPARDTSRGEGAVKLLIHHAAPQDYLKAVHSAFPNIDVIVTSDAQALHSEIRDVDIILTSGFPVSALQDASKLKWIQSTNSGVDFLVPVREQLQGAVVTNARGVHGEVMADYVLGVATMLQWNFPELLRQQAARQWRSKFVDPLSSKTMGIVGLGAVGAEIAKRAKSAGMTVLGMRRGGPREGEHVDRYYSRERFHELLGESDFVVLVVPATPETRRLIGAAEFSAMKRSGFLINLARGSVVDEAALIQSLSSAEIAGAALDVFEVEPLQTASPLWAMPNIIVTSHIAGNPTEYSRRVLQIFLDNLQRFLRGAELVNAVNLMKGY